MRLQMLTYSQPLNNEILSIKNLQISCYWWKWDEIGINENRDIKLFWIILDLFNFIVYSYCDSEELRFPILLRVQSSTDKRFALIPALVLYKCRKSIFLEIEMTYNLYFVKIYCVFVFDRKNNLFYIFSESN